MNRNIISSDNGTKGLFITFAAALVLALPLRAYQLFFLIDPETGFFAKTNFTVVLLYGLLILAGAAFAFLSFFPKDMPFGNLPAGGKVFAALSFLVAVSMVIDAGVQTSEIFAFLTFTDAAGYATPGRVPMDSLFSSESVMVFARIILAIISCIYFAILGFSCCGIIYDASQFRVLALSPLAWVIARLVSDFMWKINYRNISDLILEMFMLAAFMFFFLAFARINADIGRQSAYRKLYAFGFTGALIALTTTVPKLLLTVTGRAEGMIREFRFSFADFFVGIFIVYYLFASIKSEDSSESGEEI